MKNSPVIRRTIETTYLGPTNLKGSRVVAATPGESRAIYPWDCSVDALATHRDAALKLAHKLGWKFKGEVLTGSTKHGYIHLFPWRGAK